MWRNLFYMYLQNDCFYHPGTALSAGDTNE